MLGSPEPFLGDSWTESRFAQQRGPLLSSVFSQLIKSRVDLAPASLRTN